MEIAENYSKSFKDYLEILSNKTRFITFDKKTYIIKNIQSVNIHFYLSLLKFKINKDEPQ